MTRVIPASVTADDLSTVVADLVPLVGLVALGWSPSVVLAVYVADLVAVCVWTLVKIPFARKRSNNYLDRLRQRGTFRFRLIAPLQAKRGGLSLPGQLPPVYLRNLPGLAVGVFLAPLLALAGFLIYASTHPQITAATAGSILIGAVTVFVARGVATWRSYFTGGYREHSARSLLLVPLRYGFVVAAALLVVLVVQSADLTQLSPFRGAAVAAVGKLAYDSRTLWLARDEDRRGLIKHLYGSERTEIEPEPIDVPDEAPLATIAARRRDSLLDTLAAGGRYLASVWGVVAAGIVALGVVGGSLLLALVGLGIATVFVSLRAVVRYLRYGTLTYRCYEDTVVVYDRVLDAPQARTRHAMITDVTVERGWLDRILGTETVDVAVAAGTDGLSMSATVPDPEDVDTGDDAGRDVSIRIRHVSDPESFLAALDADR